MKKFLNNEVIFYDVNGLTGFGKIRGLSTSLPLAGGIYIVEDLEKNFPNETYPFDCFCVSELHLYCRKN